MLRRLPLPLRARLASLSYRQTRYITIAFVFFVVLLLIPHHSSRSRIPSHFAGEKKFPIQAHFKRETRVAKRTREGRQKKVLEAFLHAWHGYTKHAWLHDEISPLSGGFRDPYVGWAATLVDSLDTLYILGLQDEFERGLVALESIDFTQPNSPQIPVFETTIRYLGGLLGAYDISGAKYPILLQKADELGEFLFLSFKTPNGIPVPYFRWQSNQKLKGELNVIIAQIGSLSLEFTRLAQLTGKRKYFDAISKITNYLDDAQNHTQIPGLWPSTVDTRGPTFKGGSFTLGAWSDSLYEYLPKEHLLLGGETDQYLRMYRTALDAATKHLFFRAKVPTNTDLIFTGDARAGMDGNSKLTPDVQHLGCFVGGMVGLGSRITNSSSELKTAIQLTDGCGWAYESTATGLMPEIFTLEKCPVDGALCDWPDEATMAPGMQHGFKKISDSSYRLRPEAIESIFVMYRITGDPLWQEKGWDIFQAIIKHTTTTFANARISDVTDALNPRKVDEMESFWLAETLKYFYLLFSTPDVVNLDDFVLNTEAHPFRLRDMHAMKDNNPPNHTQT